MTQQTAPSQRRPGIKTLLSVLNESSPLGTPEEEWEIALDLAHFEKISPWFVSRLSSSAIAFSPALETRLNTLQRDFTIAAFFWCGELKGLLRSFHNEGIPVIPLKGPALAERIYGSTSLRANADLDILVRKSDFARAQALLGNLGFAADEFDRYHQPWIRGTTMVELHEDVVDPRWFNFDIGTAWECAKVSDFQGVPMFQLSDEDELLFLAMHGVRHGFDKLTYILDVALAAKRLERTPLKFRPEVAPLQGQLLLGYTLARRLLPQVCPILSLPGSDKKNRDIASLAAQLESEFLSDAVTPMNRRQRNRLHRMLEPSLHEKLGRFRRQLVFACQQPFAVNYRDRHFAAGLGFSRTWQVVILRQLRIVLKALGLRDR